jgi:hypothetical protein
VQAVADKYRTRTDSMTAKVQEFLRRHVWPRLKDPALLFEVSPAAAAAAICRPRCRFRSKWCVLPMPQTGTAKSRPKTLRMNLNQLAAGRGGRLPTWAEFQSEYMTPV